MSSWKGKSRGTTSGYRIFIWVLKKFGVLPTYFLLSFVAFYFFLFSPTSSKNIYYLYHQKLGYGKLRSLFKIYRNYFRLGQSLIDKIAVMAGINNKFTFDFDGEENLREITALKKGGMLLSAHIGNWDIAGFLLNRLDTRIHIVLFDGEHEKIKQYLETITGKKRLNIIVIKNDLSHIYQISEAFSKNELVCMHADRFLEGNKTLSTNFLGTPAKFPIGPFLLAKQFNVPVSFVFALKEKTFHYHFFASEMKQYHQLEKKQAMQVMLNDFVQEIERKVNAYPAQWYNYYNFWQ